MTNDDEGLEAMWVFDHRVAKLRKLRRRLDESGDAFRQRANDAQSALVDARYAEESGSRDNDVLVYLSRAAALLSGDTPSWGRS